MERSEDGRWIVVDGRRWRAEDPELDPEIRDALVSELMSARRAVKAALRTPDDGGERAARDRVQRAKVALGERGTPWWERTDDERDAAIRACLDQPPD